MRLRDPSERPPFSTWHSELFEAGYFSLERNFPFLGEAYDYLDWMMSQDPISSSEPLSADFGSREFRLAVTPRTTRYPSLRVLIEVERDERRVRLWHLSVRA